MDLVHDERASVIVEEQEQEEADRISSLPDDVIHRILSFLEIKYAIQTSALSKKWKYIWTLMPQLNFDSRLFSSISQYAIFVKHALSHRNNRKQVSAVELTFTGAANQFFVRSIVNYAYSHNVQQLKITLFANKLTVFPRYFFSCHTLKHLTIVFNHQDEYECDIQNPAWDWPVLETLYLEGIRLGSYDDKILNLFSKCVNLKDLTLHRCCTYASGIINICGPQLSSLTITGSEKLRNTFNVVASHLENLSLTITSTSQINFLELAPEGFNSIEKVNLSSSYECSKARCAVLLDLFPKLHSAKYLTLDRNIYETLSSFLNQLSHEPCPFDNLKCLKINTSLVKLNDRTPTIPTQIKNYFLDNSPNATLIMDPPRVLYKRPMVNNDAMTNKVAEKSEPDTMSEEKRMSEVKIRMQDEVISEQQAINTTHLKQSDCIPTLPNASFIMDMPQKLPQKRSMGQVNNVITLEAEKSQPDTMTEEERMLEANIQMQNEVISEQQAINTTHLKQNDCIPTTTPTQVQNHLLENSPDATFIMDLPQVSHKRSLEPVHNELTTSKKVAKLGEKVQMQDDVVAKQQAMFEAKIQMRDKVIADQKAMFEAKIQMQDEVNAKQKAMFEAKIQSQDEVIAEHKGKIQMQNEVIAMQKAMFEAKIQMQDKVIADQMAMFEAKIQMQDEVNAKQKAMFEAKTQMQDRVIADQKAKIQMQDEVNEMQKVMSETKIQVQDIVIADQKAKIKMQDEVDEKQKAMFETKVQMQDKVIADKKAKIQILEVATLQHEKLMSHIIKCKIAELKLQVESGNPDYEVIRLIGRDIKSTMNLVPESLRVVMEARFSFQYVELKSLLLTRIDASQWAQIETELGNIRDSQSVGF